MYVGYPSIVSIDTKNSRYQTVSQSFFVAEHCSSAAVQQNGCHSFPPLGWSVATNDNGGRRTVQADAFRALQTEEVPMSVQSPAELVKKKCLPCEGGVDPYSPDDAKSQLKQLSGWQLTHDGQR